VAVADVCELTLANTEETEALALERLALAEESAAGTDVADPVGLAVEREPVTLGRADAPIVTAEVLYATVLSESRTKYGVKFV